MAAQNVLCVAWRYDGGYRHHLYIKTIQCNNIRSNKQYIHLLGVICFSVCLRNAIDVALTVKAHANQLIVCGYILHVISLIAVQYIKVSSELTAECN